jgi:integrase
VIPASLRATAGKVEIVVSLRTKEVRSAGARYLTVHEAIERWLRSLGAPEAPETPPEAQAFDLAPYVARLTARPSGGHDRSAAYANQTPSGHASPCQPFRLSDCLRVYLAEKKVEFASYRGRALQTRLAEKHRVLRYLIEALEEDREVTSLTRTDARLFRDHLVAKGLAAGSVRKILNIAAAIVECGLVDQRIALRNPIRGLHVVNELAAIEARHPLNRNEIDILRTIPVNNELATIVELLVLTGARLNEIAGLEWQDVSFTDDDAAPPSITIRTNAIRRLKTANSKRQVPLTSEATDALLRLRHELAGEAARGAIFPRYGRPGGPDAASAALMKAFRKAGVLDRRKSIHSLRHSFKQALRDVGCPKDVRDAIQGHSNDSISEHYGSGASLINKLKWMILAKENIYT